MHAPPRGGINSATLSLHSSLLLVRRKTSRRKRAKLVAPFPTDLVFLSLAKNRVSRNRRLSSVTLSRHVTVSRAESRLPGLATPSNNRTARISPGVRALVQGSLDRSSTIQKIRWSNNYSGRIDARTQRKGSRISAGRRKGERVKGGRRRTRKKKKRKEGKEEKEREREERESMATKYA